MLTPDMNNFILWKWDVKFVRSSPGPFYTKNRVYTQVFLTQVNPLEIIDWLLKSLPSCFVSGESYLVSWKTGTSRSELGHVWRNAPTRSSAETVGPWCLYSIDHCTVRLTSHSFVGLTHSFIGRWWIEGCDCVTAEPRLHDALSLTNLKWLALILFPESAVEETKDSSPSLIHSLPHSFSYCSHKHSLSLTHTHTHTHTHICECSCAIIRLAVNSLAD